MKIQTTRFGEIEIPEEKFISIPDGILGMPDAVTYVLLEHDSEGTPFKWLQAVDNPDLAFIVMDPRLVVENFQVDFEDELLQRYQIHDINEEFAFMSIVNIPRENPIAMTVNLRAPIIVHMKKRLGWQQILPNEDYPIRHRLFPDPEEESETSSQAGG
ncbi:MAG: flagellar assembly protein FliW [Candidatus Sumerlaeia bacterium]